MTCSHPVGLKLALLTLVMHIGVLVGKKRDSTVEVVDAIPLFHERVMSGSLEVAFDMIQSTLHATGDKDLKIVGLYEASLSHKGEGATSFSQLLAETIRNNHF